MLPLVWLNKSIVTINAPLQLLYIDEASKNVIKWDNIEWFSAEYVCNGIVCWFLIFVSDDIVYYTITALSDLHQINATMAVVKVALHQARSLGFDRTV